VWYSVVSDSIHVTLWHTDARELAGTLEGHGVAFTAQAATEHDIEPRSISFKGTLQTLERFQPAIDMMGQHDSDFCMHLYEQLLVCVASHRVGNRSDRFEPRKIKRRHGKYDLLTKPRNEEKRLMAK